MTTSITSGNTSETTLIRKSKYMKQMEKIAFAAVRDRRDIIEETREAVFGWAMLSDIDKPTYNKIQRAFEKSEIDRLVANGYPDPRTSAPKDATTARVLTTKTVSPQRKAKKGKGKKRNVISDSDTSQTDIQASPTKKAKVALAEADDDIVFVGGSFP